MVALQSHLRPCVLVVLLAVLSVSFARAQSSVLPTLKAARESSRELVKRLLAESKQKDELGQDVETQAAEMPSLDSSSIQAPASVKRLSELSSLSHLVRYTTVELPLAGEVSKRVLVHYPPGSRSMAGAFCSVAHFRASDSSWVPEIRGESIDKASQLLSVLGSLESGVIAVREGSDLVMRIMKGGQLLGTAKRVRLPKELLQQPSLKLVALSDGIGVMGLPNAASMKLPIDLSTGEIGKRISLPDASSIMAQRDQLRAALSIPKLPEVSLDKLKPELPFDLASLKLPEIEGRAKEVAFQTKNGVMDRAKELLTSTRALGKDKLSQARAAVNDSSLKRQAHTLLETDARLLSSKDRVGEIGTAASAGQAQLISKQTALTAVQPQAVFAKGFHTLGTQSSESLPASFGSPVSNQNEGESVEKSIPSPSASGAVVGNQSRDNQPITTIKPAIGLGQGARTSVASKAASIWYFGNGVGLDFNESPPRVLSGGAMHQLEGMASVCDASGRLLFYSDGMTVYDRRHQVMAAGEGLLGHTSSSTSALIAPYPGRSGDYLVFTSGVGGYIDGNVDGVHYSVVSFSAAEPFGWVTVKNLPVIASATERMLAVEHADGESIWLITQVADGSEFHTFLFTRDGLFAQPVISRSNQIAARSASTIGYLKASLDGTTLALTNLGDWQVEVFDFNPKSGEVLYRYELSHEVLKVQPEQAIRTPYGVEFSPDGSRLYVTCSQTRELRQFDLKAGSAEAVARSQRISKAQDFDGQLGAIQLSPEGRLFFTGFEDRLGRATRVGVVERPNESDAGVDFTGYVLGPNQASYGLPIPFPRYLKQLNGDFSATRFCSGLPTQFEPKSNLKPDSYAWDFGDPDSGDDNSSGEASPSHTYRDTGSYEVRLTVRLGDQVEHITRTVHISQRPSLELGDNVPLVLGSSTILTAEVEAEQFQWMTGSTEELLTVAAPGLYTARAVRGSCVCGDSVRVLPVWQTSANNNNQSLDTDSPSATNSLSAGGTNSSLIEGLRAASDWFERHGVTPTLAAVWFPQSLNSLNSSVFRGPEQLLTPPSPLLYPSTLSGFHLTFGLRWRPFLIGD